MHHVLAAVVKSIRNAVCQHNKRKDPLPSKNSGSSLSTQELDQLSNSVVDLIKQNNLDEAETVSRKLLTEYPDQIDGFNRLAMVYEARGEIRKAAEHYRKAYRFAMSNEGFDQDSADWFLSEAKRLESEK